MYNPKSVVEAMLRHRFGNYWNQTETYDALKIYIQMNMDGLKDAIIEMLADNSVRINIGTFHNDMTTFATRDDILTLLVHLGYLTSVSYTHLDVYKRQLLKRDINQRNHRYQDVQTVKSALIKRHHSQREIYNPANTLTGGRS